MSDILWLAVPCYNEQEVLPETARRLKVIMEGLISRGKISSQSRVCFINDGSKDRTWELIEEFCRDDELFAGVCLSRNRGHQNALMAGLMTAKTRADMVISLDADLQDDVAAIEKIVDKYYQGNDIVYGVRSSRETDSVGKRSTAHAYYRLLEMLGVEIVYDHADYRLMSRRALEALELYGETNLFLRGIVPQLGFSTATVEYERQSRFAGESKYPLKKMLALASDGVTSFSIRPLRMIWLLGFSALIGALVLLVCAIVLNEAALWICFTLCALGGAQLCAIGAVGEYVGKAYMETKRRPRYIIKDVLLR